MRTNRLTKLSRAQTENPRPEQWPGVFFWLQPGSSGLEDQFGELHLDASLGIAITAEGVREQSAGLIALGPHGDREQPQQAEAFWIEQVPFGVGSGDSSDQELSALMGAAPFESRNLAERVVGLVEHRQGLRVIRPDVL